MRSRLLVKYKDAFIETRQEPIVIPGFDIYMIDNQFGETSMAIGLLGEI